MSERILIRLGHYSTHLVLLAIAAAVINDSLNGHVAAVQYVNSAVWIAWAVSIAADLNCHQRRLCERCISAAPTLDPDSSVRRWLLALRCYHRKIVNLIAMIAVLAWVVYFATVNRQHPWQYALDAVAVTVLGAKYLIDHQHQRLYPWCPYCRWDEGGDEEVAPPVPTVPQSR